MKVFLCNLAIEKTARSPPRPVFLGVKEFCGRFSSLQGDLRRKSERENPHSAAAFYSYEKCKKTTNHGPPKTTVFYQTKNSPLFTKEADVGKCQFLTGFVSQLFWIVLSV
jgi:hypothetical protein